MVDTTYTHELEAAIVAITDGTMRSWWDIQGHTGLSEQRSKELEVFINRVFDNYKKRSGN